MFFELNENPVDLTITISIALMAGLAIALLYSRSNNDSEYTRSFSFTLAVTTVIMSAVSMTIGTNIAVSIGLFGILSILRFRASVKNIKDMAYLLLAVAGGLTAGSQNFLLTLCLGVSFVFIVALFKVLASSQTSTSEYILIIASNDDVNVQLVADELKIAGISFEIKSSLTNKVSAKQEITISLVNANSEQISTVTESIKAIAGIDSVSLISPHSTLPD